MALENTTKIFVRNPVGVLTNHGDIRILGLQCLAQVGLLQNFNLILYEDSCAMIRATAAQHVQGQILFLCGQINVPNPARTTVSGCELPHV